MHIELDLTPGIALADAILADIDRDRDGSLSTDEQRSYGSLVLTALDVEIDGVRVPVQLDAFSFPGAAAVLRGEGTIRFQLAALLPRLSVGAHRLLFRNRHHPARSVYLANALVPASDRVAVVAQRRAADQHELTIDYLMRPVPATHMSAGISASIVAAAALSALLIYGRKKWRSGEQQVDREGAAERGRALPVPD